MAVLTEVVEGWSAALPFVLKADGTAVDLSGLTVTGEIHDRFRVAVLTSDTVSVTSSTGGYVAWTPNSSDLSAARSPYSVRFKVADPTSAVVYFANGQSDTLVVYPE
jgi:hypothetical protein